MLSEKELLKIEELIKEDVKSGKIELVPEDKIFDFLPKNENAVNDVAEQLTMATDEEEN